MTGTVEEASATPSGSVTIASTTGPLTLGAFNTTNTTNTTGSFSASDTNGQTTVTAPITSAADLSISGGAGVTNTASALTSNAGNVSLSSTAGNIVSGGVISANQVASLTSGPAGNIGITANVTGGTGVNLTSSTITNSATVTATNDNIVVQGNNGTHSVNLTNTGSLVTKTGDIDFNTTSPGSVTVSGAGSLLAGNSGAPMAFVNLNIGAGTATVNQNAITGCVIDPGTTSSGSVSITAATGNLSAGGFTATQTGATVSLNATTGSLTTCGDITANGAVALNAANQITNGNNITSNASSVSLTTSAMGSVVQNDGAISAHTIATLSTGSSPNNGLITSDAQVTGGTGVSLIAGTLDNTAGITATTGNVTIQSNGPANALTINNGGAIQSSAGNVVLNGTGTGNAGSITIANNGTAGTITAIPAAGQPMGLVTTNIGTGTLTATQGGIAGCIQNPGMAVSGAVSITTASGTLSAGNYNTSSTFTATNTGGNVATCGNITAAGEVDLTAGAGGTATIAAGNTVTGNAAAGNPGVQISAGTLNDNGQVIAQTGNLNVDNSGKGTLTINMGPAVGGKVSALEANSANAAVNLNSLAPGAITITGGPGNGLISAAGSMGKVNVDGGTGDVNTTNRQIIGCINVTGDNISMTTSVGGLMYCSPITTTGNVTLAANGGLLNTTSAPITTSVNAPTGSAGNISLTGKTGIDTGNLIADGSGGASGGNISLHSGGNIAGTIIESTGYGGGNGGSVTIVDSHLTLTSQNGNGNSIETLAGAGKTGAVSITSTSGQPLTVGHGGNATGNGTFGFINGGSTPPPPPPPNPPINPVTPITPVIGGNGGNGGSGFGLGAGNGSGLATGLLANTNNFGNIFLNNALLASLAGLNGDENIIFDSKTATDITEIFQYASEDEADVHKGYINQDEYRKRVRQLIQGTKTFANAMTSEESATLVKNGVTVGSGDVTKLGANFFDITRGNVVFNPTHDIVVNAGDAQVHIGGGSHVFVIDNGHDVAVYNLHQDGRGKVYVVSGNQKLTVGTAQMAVLTKNGAKDFDSMEGEAKIISYRSVRPVELQNGYKAYMGEFSIPSAFATVVPLNKMLSSSDAKDKAAVDRILTSQVVLTSMMGAGSPFENGQPAR